MAGLTVGAIEALFDNQTDSPLLQGPVLQIVNIKALPANSNNPNATPRYRLLISDGNLYTQAMLSHQMNHLFANGSIQKNTVVKLTQFLINTVQGKRLVILLNFDIIDHPGVKIGNPQNILEARNQNNVISNQQRQQQPQQPQRSNSFGQADHPRFGGNQEQQQDQQGGYRPYQPPQQPQQQFSPHQQLGNQSANLQGRFGGGGGNSGFGGVGGGSMFGSNNMPSGITSSQPDFNNVVPISSITPYSNTNKWCIRARVMSKSEIRHWSNQKGEGKLFSCVLMDESGEIKATAFQEAVDKFYDVIQENKVFYIAKVRVTMARKQYSNLDNDYEITLDAQTVIDPCHDTENVPTIQFNFVSLDRLMEYEKDSTIDVIGVVKERGELTELISKTTQRKITKRDIIVVDHTGYAVKLTLWAKNAENFDSNEPGSVVAIKGAKVSDYGGRSLSMYSSSTLLVNPEIEDAYSMRGWWSSDGQYISPIFYSSGGVNAGSNDRGGGRRNDQLKDLAQVKEERLGMGDKPDFFAIRATIHYINNKKAQYYAACPSEGCNKKVVEDGAEWRCEKCNQSYPHPDYRYIMQINVSDHTDSNYLVCFNDVAQMFMNMSANDLAQLKNDNETAYNDVHAQAILKQYVFNVKANMEHYRDETRLRLTCMNATPVEQNYVWLGNQLADTIEEWLQY